MVIGLLLAFLLEYLDDTLKTADDVERFASLSVLGAIPVVGAQASASPAAPARTLTASRGG